MDSSDDEFQALESMNVSVPECEGLPRQMWNTKCVTLYNDDGELVGEGTCHSVNSDLVLGDNGPVGDTHVSVHISKSHSEVDIPHEHVYSLVAWPIQLVHRCGASLKDHEARDSLNRAQVALLNCSSSMSGRPYISAMRNSPRETGLKSKELLTQESINAVSSKVCCSQNYIQPFPRWKIRAFRERMYWDSTFKQRTFIKMDVHRHIHRDVRGKRMITIEGINVCLHAWMNIAGVPESTFYRYLKYMKEDREARDHGNTGSKKTREHTKQATASLKCILDGEVDHMPYRS